MFFLFLHKSTRGYSFEALPQGASNVFPYLCFYGDKKKNICLLLEKKSALSGAMTEGLESDCILRSV